ncbi:MAG: MFS transporter [Pirellulaceae bacterium]|nr:MFS transporter [Pirellulaceae bacterium]
MVNKNDQYVFWGCFIALITTAFGFITRMFLIGTWATEFNLDPAEAGRLAGIGIWPFAVSIIGFSLFIDRIGYKTAMFLAFAGHAIWAVMGVSAYFVSHQEFATPEAKAAAVQTAYSLLYWGSLILGLGNGTVEAFINPVVATMFSREKTKWLNILHAGWPGGLVIAGIIVIFMGNLPWGLKVGIIGAPAIIYLLMLTPCRFPISERVASNVSYREMLAEFGILGAAIVGILISLQLMDFFNGVPALSVEVDGRLVLATWARGLFIGIGVLIVVAFGAYTQALGRPLMFLLVLIMMPLATTEIGTDGWITGIMEGVFEMSPEEVEAAGGMDKVLVINGVAYRLHPGWVLVYTSAIMMILRFCAGPIVHAFSPLGLLAVSSVLAIAGLYTLSLTAGLVIFGAATLYALGKTFFWPTMLGVVAEQCPKGGALTLNAISGIGMLAVGTLGFPFIGALQANKQIDAVVASELAQQIPGLVVDGQLAAVTSKSIYEIIRYQDIDDARLQRMVADSINGDPAALATIQAEREQAGNPVGDDEVVLTGEQQEVWEYLLAVRSRSRQQALANMAIFPLGMLICYLGLIVYFKSKGGYQAEVLVGHAAEDERFTGGVEGPVE